MKKLLLILLMGFSTMSYSSTKCFKISFAVVGESTNNAEIICSQSSSTAWDELYKRYQSLGKTLTRISVKEINIGSGYN